MIGHFKLLAPLSPFHPDVAQCLGRDCRVVPEIFFLVETFSVALNIGIVCSGSTFFCIKHMSMLRNCAKLKFVIDVGSNIMFCEH